MLAFTLTKNIACENVCAQISRFVDSYRNQNQDCGDLVLTVNINKIIDSTDNPLPKLTNKENTLTS